MHVRLEEGKYLLGGVPDDIFAAARCPGLTGLCCVQIVWKGTKAFGCAKKFCP